MASLQEELQALRESEKKALIENAGLNSTIDQLNARIAEKDKDIEWHKAKSASGSR